MVIYSIESRLDGFCPETINPRVEFEQPEMRITGGSHITKIYCIPKCCDGNIIDNISYIASRVVSPMPYSIGEAIPDARDLLAT